ncbi:hypothetical protein HanXRQr2_Chr13g0595271 [Helianthus annuus]|uniref:Uncharacterized protein n=1 Tax=Helianthus annuus TaxID=4232 RepID=A0A251UU82_HELAN|nr:hypothetical protein HanXRQr2_Chr13g0595271 [Helianthus annuus]
MKSTLHLGQTRTKKVKIYLDMTTFGSVLWYYFKFTFSLLLRIIKMIVTITITITITTNADRKCQRRWYNFISTRVHFQDLCQHHSTLHRVGLLVI